MTPDLTPLALGLAYATILVSVIVSRVLRLPLGKELIVSTVRMGVQLALVGVYLTWLFEWNHPALTAGYLLLMLAAANWSVLRNGGLRLTLFPLTFTGLLLGIGTVLVFYLAFVFQPRPFYEARTVIPIAGMLLGNSMNRSIVTLERFYSSLRDDTDGYVSLLTLGASVDEATLPYLRAAYRAGIGPWLAVIATMGVVSLPGMMTGQILGGSAPMVAIKYQVAIVLAIFLSTELSTLLMIQLSRRRAFDSFGLLRADVFREQP